MKKIVPFLLVSMAFCCFGQSESSFGVISTYDYNSSLKNDDISAFDSTIKKPYYLEATKNNETFELHPYPSLSDLLKKITNKKKLIIYIHGDNGRLSDLLKRSQEFQTVYDANFLLFTWASHSIENRSRKNYSISKENVLKTMPQFMYIMNELNEYITANGIECSIMFHSLGNLFAKNLARHSLREECHVKYNYQNIILNAACVWEQDHDIWVDVLSQNVKGKVYITQNRNDLVLRLASTFIEHGNLLGMTAPKQSSAAVNYIDFTPLLRNNVNAGESHAYFLGDLPHQVPILKEVYEKMLTGSSDFLERHPTIFLQPKSSNIYILPSSD